MTDDLNAEFVQCQHEGCAQGGQPCFLPDSDEADEWYCVEHQQQHGYCWGCGNFWAGCEDFDFDPNGLCSNCRYNPDIVGYIDEDEDGWIWNIG